MNISPLNIFYAYAKEDEEFRIQLEKHLSSLKREGIISDWHFRKLTGGDEWRKKIDHHLNNSQIILLLISSDFISSNYCYDVEMARAMELHKSQKARVIPVILRPVHWQTLPFSELQALPSDGRPVKQWPDLDEAFLDIAKGVRKACRDLSRPKTADSQVSSTRHINFRAWEAWEPQFKGVYCARCGATPGQPSTCIGNYQHHNFMSYSGEVYCAHCGAIAGRKSTCTGIDPFHEFMSYSSNAYCARCGATPGQPSTCIGNYQHHNFMSYSGKVYCSYCGATAGTKSTCTGIDPYHNFVSYP